jgi:quinol monooxygenase YgiN
LRGNAGQFLFCELFADDAAYTVHQTRDYFKTLIVEQALSLLDRRERTLYALL